MSLRSFFCLGAAVLWPAAAAAQGPAELESVIVTASRVNAGAAQPFSVTTIPLHGQASGQSAADVLVGLADVHVQAPGGRSGVSSLFLRGSDPNFTVIQLDGVPLNASTNSRGGAVNVSELDMAGIERAEVVAGPLSSLYGSGALSGVVNFVVPGGTPDHRFGVGAGVGSDEDYFATLKWRGPLAGNLGGSLTATVSDDGSVYPGSAFRSWSLTGKAAGKGADDDARLVFRISETDARGFPDSSGGPRLATLRELERREGREGLVGLRAPVFQRGALDVLFDASYLSRRDFVVSPGVAPSAFDSFGVPAGQDLSRYERLAGALSARLRSGAWSAAAGIEAQVEDGRSEGFMDFFGFQMPTGFNLDRSAVAAFAEVGRASDNLTFNVGLRVDDTEGLDARVTARTGVRYAIPETPLAVRASVGTAYKAPSFYALGNPFVGNPDLAPERSRGAEAAVEWAIAEGSAASLTVFHNRYANLIDFVPGPPPQLQNRKLVVSKGASAAVTWKFDAKTTATVQATYATTEDDETGAQLLTRPIWRVTSSVSWRPLETLALTARHSYVGPRTDYAIPTGTQRLEGYNLVSLDAALSVRDSAVVRLSVDNLLDEEVEAAIGFPSPGVRARLALSYDF